VAQTRLTGAILRAYKLCKNFGWTLEQLGIPKEDEHLFLSGFEMIMDCEDRKKA
jgi:hypothetical protein